MQDFGSVPRVAISADGKLLAADATRSLARVEVHDRLSRPRLCELRFFGSLDTDPPTARLQPGTPLRVSLPDANQHLFAGDVTSVEMIYESSSGREFRVVAFDRLHRLRKRQPVRIHRHFNLIELAREMCAADGIDVKVELAVPTWDTLMQYRETDFDLLLDVAARCGVHFVLDDVTLHFVTLAGRGDPLPLTLGSSLLEARVERSAAPACRSVTTRAWDPWVAQQRSGKATAGMARGSEILDRMGCSGHWSLLDENFQRDQQAEALAQSELDHRVAAELVLQGVADGNAALRAGSVVNVRGIDEDLGGPYVLSEVAHYIDATRGFVSEISSRPPKRPGRPWGTITSFGVVSSVDDPDGYGRVKVTLPTYEDLESDWLSVTCPGGGPRKGLVALPDVGDRVLVLFPREAPGQGVVIGSLFGTDAPPLGIVENGAVRTFALQTAGGQFLRLNDAEQTVRLENRDGSFVELAPDGVRVHATGDLDIAAPGHAVTIRGNSIDFREA